MESSKRHSLSYSAFLCETVFPMALQSPEAKTEFSFFQFLTRQRILSIELYVDFHQGFILSDEQEIIKLSLLLNFLSHNIINMSLPILETHLYFMFLSPFSSIVGTWPLL